MSESDQPAAPDPWESVPRGPVQATPPPPGAPESGYGPGYAPAYGPGPYPPPGAMPSYYGYPGFQPRRTNGLSIAAMVCGICGFLYLIPAVLGIIFGIIALNQIKRDRSDGKGMAITGIVVGALWILALVGFIGLVVAFSDNGGQ